MNSLHRKILNGKSDEQLLKLYHSHPIKNIIVNLIFATVLIITLASGSSLGDYYLLALIGVSIIGTILSQAICPLGVRSWILEILKSRGKNIYSLEKKYGITYNEKLEIVLCIIAIILVVFNYLFNILAAVIILVLSLAIAVAWGGILYLLYIIAGAGASNGLADVALRLSKASCVPAKYAFAYFKSVMSFNVFRSIKEDVGYRAQGYTSDAGETDPAYMSKELSNLQISNYLSLSGLVSGGNVRIVRDSVVARFNNVEFEIDAVIDAIGDQFVDTANITRSIESDATNILEGQIAKFLSDYPNADPVEVRGRVTLEVARR